MMLLNDVCFVLHVTPFLLSFVLSVLINYITREVASSERLLLWQSSGMFLYSTVIILMFYVVLENKI